MTIEAIIVLLVFLIVLLGLASFSVRIVREYERLIVFRLGRALGAKGPGLVLLIPFVDTGVRVDLREMFFDVDPQTCITKDNAPLSIDFLVYMKVVNALHSVLEVEDFRGAARGIAVTTLRALVGDMLLDDVLSKRDQLNELLQGKMDLVTDRWGIKVSAVEIREIIPPREIQDAMSRQMSAERHRRAAVTDSEGKREASIIEAEGSKQARILTAEGQREAEILEAEGKRQAVILEAEAYAQRLERVFEIARGIDSKTISLEYLDTLRDMGNNVSTKFIFPTEFMSLLGPLRNQMRDDDAT